VQVLLYSIYLACFTAGWFIDRPGSAAFFQGDQLKNKFLDARELGLFSALHAPTLPLLTGPRQDYWRAGSVPEKEAVLRC